MVLYQLSYDPIRKGERHTRYRSSIVKSYFQPTPPHFTMIRVLLLCPGLSLDIPEVSADLSNREVKCSAFHPKVALKAQLS